MVSASVGSTTSEWRSPPTTGLATATPGAGASDPPDRSANSTIAIVASPTTQGNHVYFAYQSGGFLRPGFLLGWVLRGAGGVWVLATWCLAPVRKRPLG